LDTNSHTAGCVEVQRVRVSNRDARVSFFSAATAVH